jgi:hypothetical protein
MKIIYCLAALTILGNSCGNNNADPPIAEDDSAVNMTYFWEASLNDSTQRLEMKKVETMESNSLTASSVINFINSGNTNIRLDLVKTSNDTIYIKIADAEYLTQRMGSAGPTMYFAATVYNLTEISGIRFVNFDFEEGDHAQPGTYDRDSFKND